MGIPPDHEIMTVSESIAWLLVAVLVLIVWEQNRTIWKLLDTIDAAIDLMETAMDRAEGPDDRGDG